MKWNVGGMVNMNKMNYFKYLVKRHWKLELVISAGLFMIVTVACITSVSDSMIFYVNIKEACKEALIYLFYSGMFYSCAISCFTPIYLNYYLYRKQSVDLYLSLPMKREKMYDTHFLYGCFSVVVPTVVCCIISVICLFVKGLDVTILPFQIIGVIVLVNVILQAIITLLSVKANKLLDAIVAAFGFIIVPLVVILSVYFTSSVLLSRTVVGFTLIGDELPFTGIISNLISLPVIAFGAFENFFNLKPITLTSSSLYYLLWWSVIGIIAYIYAKKSYVKRAAEDSEQYTSSKLIYPLMIHVGLASILMMITLMESEYVVKFILIGIIFLGYLVSMFFAHRKIKLRLVYVLTFVGIYVVTSLFTWSFEQTNGYGMVHEIPNISQIKNIRVDYYYEEGSDYHYVNVNQSHFVETYKKIESITQSCVEVANDDDHYNMIDITYELKNGNKIYRYYEFDEEKIHQDALELIEMMTIK